MIFFFFDKRVLREEERRGLDVLCSVIFLRLSLHFLQSRPRGSMGARTLVCSSSTRHCGFFPMGDDGWMVGVRVWYWARVVRRGGLIPARVARTWPSRLWPIDFASVSQVDALFSKKLTEYCYTREQGLAIYRSTYRHISAQVQSITPRATCVLAFCLAALIKSLLSLFCPAS